MAMARHRAHVAPEVSALLVYSARTWDEVIFGDELIALDLRDPNFELVLTTTRGPRHRPTDYDRRLDPSRCRNSRALGAEADSRIRLRLQRIRRKHDGGSGSGRHAGRARARRALRRVTLRSWRSRNEHALARLLLIEQLVRLLRVGQSPAMREDPVDVNAAIRDEPGALGLADARASTTS
jgi:hypothetical protein